MINNYDLPDYVANAYKNAYPYPSITIDNFFDDYMLTQAMEELKRFQYWCNDHQIYSATAEELYKEFAPYSFNDESVNNFRTHAPITNMIINYLYSEPVLRYLERLTGIPDLLGDPDLMGGGVHRILTGGKLDIHADFNLQPNRNVWRRINLLLYLNKDWNTDWGGDLELWDRDMSKCCVKIAPVFNRAAIFNITDDAFHGHPHPLRTPPGVTRDSIALYYYTADRPEHEKAPFHPVVWKKIGRS